MVGESTSTDDFLSRERALLGDDADQFTSGNDRAATVEDGDEDLLGGEFSQANVGTQEMDGFQSSFPAIDTTNEVGNALLLPPHANLRQLALGQQIRLRVQALEEERAL